MYGSLKAEALNRITKEVRKAIPEFRQHKEYRNLDVFELSRLIFNKDDEVRPELINLIRIIIEECDESKN